MCTSEGYRCGVSTDISGQTLSLKLSGGADGLVTAVMFDSCDVFIISSEGSTVRHPPPRSELSRGPLEGKDLLKPVTMQNTDCSR